MIISETGFWVALFNRADRHPARARRFLERCFAGTVETSELDAEARARVLPLMQRYNDLPMDLADASLVILAERLGHGRIRSTDPRDFKAYRWKNYHPFVNLLLA